MFLCRVTYVLLCQVPCMMDFLLFFKHHRLHSVRKNSQKCEKSYEASNFIDVWEHLSKWISVCSILEVHCYIRSTLCKYATVQHFSHTFLCFLKVVRCPANIADTHTLLPHSCFNNLNSDPECSTTIISSCALLSCPKSPLSSMLFSLWWIALTRCYNCKRTTIFTPFSQNHLYIGVNHLSSSGRTFKVVWGKLSKLLVVGIFGLDFHPSFS